jgi:hypothetical protein
MFNVYYIDWDGDKSGDVAFATLAEAMEWIEQVILDTSIDCECEEDTLRTRFGITFNADGAYELMKLLPAPAVSRPDQRAVEPTPCCGREHHAS